MLKTILTEAIKLKIYFSMFYLTSLILARLITENRGVMYAFNIRSECNQFNPTFASLKQFSIYFNTDTENVILLIMFIFKLVLSFKE